MRDAALRAILVTLVAALPALALAGGPGGEQSRTAGLLLAAAAGLYVLVEYGARTPALIDFRFAPPINRLRFALAALTLVATTACVAFAGQPGPLGATFARFGAAMDFAFSPVRMAADIFTRASAPAPDPSVEYAAATAFCVALTCAVAFGAAIWFGPWPRLSERLNLLVNLPTSDIEDDGRGARRLTLMGAQVLATAAGSLFAMLVVGGFAVALLSPDLEISPLALVWSATIWAGAPGTMVLRGVALLKLAQRLRRDGDLGGRRP
ncbi:hypothetical protein P2H44_02375 [Albimonas sp. CAU 1670]|uniref:hypothetical protein n=1 Tax=Albimonas sp. CAU 1670 TaxID=3032599 RepID=UPI0023DA297F|nr:hypothetical protein [Albimonas sp. CAU 1670]MDF2231390.1 hypothetical protein [Albimonas sp. CAU 1670]